MAAPSVFLLFRRTFHTITLLLLSSVPGLGQEWAIGLFSRSSYDFGVLPKGSKAEYCFILNNNLSLDVHISTVTSNCKCTTATISNHQLRPGDAAQITASMDTTQLTGSQAGTITVNFDRPFQAAVQLNVQGIVHGDITLSPAIIQIGRISRGTVATASFKMRHLANTNWKIVGMTSGNDHLQADLIEARGADGEQAIRMRIKVQSDTPEGMLITHLVLQSDEKATNCLRVPLVVEVGR